MEIHLSRKHLAIIFGMILAGLLICLLTYNIFKFCRRIHVDHLYEKYEETFSEKYPEYLKQQYKGKNTLAIFRTFDSCSLSIKKEHNEYGYYNFYENYQINITVDDVFDTYLISEKYSFLEFAKNNAGIAINNIKSDQGHGAINEGVLLNKIYGQAVFIDRNVILNVKTGENTYCLNSGNKGYFYINGAEVKGRQDYTATSGSASTSASASGGSDTSSSDSTRTSSAHASRDPYNVNDYKDAEDFYFDNEDDFEDFEDAEDYYDEHHD